MNTIKKNGRRVTVELDETDCELIASALKLAASTRNVGRKVVDGVMMNANPKVVRVIGPLAERIKQTPAADRREADLLALFESASNN